MNSRSTLIHQNPIIFTPDLARIIGLNAAIVIQRLEFLLSVPKNGKEIDGYRWIYNTYKEWQEEHFPFWSYGTILRTFLQLEKSGLVASTQPDGRESRQKYYRITDAGIATLTTKNLPSNFPDENGDHRILQCSQEDRILQCSYISTENTTESTVTSSLNCSSDSNESSAAGLNSEQTPTQSFPSKQSDKPVRAKRNTPIPQPPSHEEILQAWNTLTRQPSAKNLSSTRHLHISSRLKESFFRLNWKEAIEKLRASDFCAGINSQEWKADFDWFIKPSSVEKIMEGKYDNKKSLNKMENALGGNKNIDEVNALGIKNTDHVNALGIGY